jgi:hypothetical protein
MDRQRMKRLGRFAICLLTMACASSPSRELHEVMSAALNDVDSRHGATLIANDDVVAWAQSVIGPDREVVPASRFEREHPGEAVPFNVAIESAQRQSDGSWIVHLHAMAISHPPPGTLFCGSGFELEVRRVGRSWVVNRKSEAVC